MSEGGGWKNLSAMDRLLGYLCPCWVKHYNQQESQSSVMEQKEETLADISLPTKPRQSQDNTLNVSSEKLTQIQSLLVQSRVEIPMTQNWEGSSQDDYQQMQKEYEMYTRQHKKKLVKSFPIQKHVTNRLFVLGGHQGRMLCKIKSVWLDPSPLATKRTMESSDKEKTNDPVIEKYWSNRYYLFERFDQGIKLDQQSWFSVTPEAVAKHIAARFEGFNRVLDGFCGAGGDSIQLCKHCKHVIANDIDSVKTGLLHNNSTVYGADNLTLSNSDFLDLNIKRKEVDGVYFSPPWGGPSSNQAQWMKPQDFTPSLGTLIQKGLSISDNVGILLPNNTDVESLPPLIYKAYQSLDLRPASSCMLIEKIHFMERFRFIMVWVGSSLHDINVGSELEFIYGMLGDRQTQFSHRRVVKKIREEYGMVSLLNYLFECQKDRKVTFDTSLYDQLETYLLQNDLISKEKLTELRELEQIDMERQEKSEIKKEKVMLSSIGRNRKRRKVKRQLSHAIEQAEQEQEPQKVQVQPEQTVSYISGFSESSLGDSRPPNRFSGNHEPALIQKIQEAVSERQSDQQDK